MEFTVAIVEGQIMLSNGRVPGENVYLKYTMEEPMEPAEFIVSSSDSQPECSWKFHIDQESEKVEKVDLSSRVFELVSVDFNEDEEEKAEEWPLEPERF